MADGVTPVRAAVAHDGRDLLPSGHVLGSQYQIVKWLGGGAMGDVYLAAELELDRFVALKLLRREIESMLEADKRFRREARLLSRLPHPHTVSVHNFGRTKDGGYFIVMEYVEGHDLSDRLRSVTRLAPAVASHVLSQVAAAVGEAHRTGIVHRDLKPANILLTTVDGDAEFVKVADFGLAKAVLGDEGEGADPDLAISVAGGVMGSPPYISPEQVRGEEIDGRADIYSLAVVATQMLTGGLPISGRAPMEYLLAHLQQAPIPPSELHPEAEIPAAVDAVVLRALEKDRDRRFETIADFAKAFAEAVERWAGPAAPGLQAPQPTTGDAAIDRTGDATTILSSCPSCGESVDVEDADAGSLTAFPVSPSLADLAGAHWRTATVLYLDFDSDPNNDVGRRRTVAWPTDATPRQALEAALDGSGTAPSAPRTVTAVGRRAGLGPATSPGGLVPRCAATRRASSAGPLPSRPTSSGCDRCTPT